MTTYDRRPNAPVFQDHHASKDSTPVEPHPWTRMSNQLGVEAPWWQQAKFPAAGGIFNTNPESLIGYGLLKKAFEGGPPVHSANWNGNLIVHPKKLLEACYQTMGLKTVFVSGNLRNGSYLLASDDTLIKINFFSRGHEAAVSSVSTNPKRMRYASQLFDRLLEQDDPRKGMVFTLAKTMHGYSLRNIGLAGNPVERSNYSKNVVAQYDAMVEDLNSETPSGRINIMAGPPGTGKTYLIRSLLSECPKSAFVIVPPSLVEDLGSPEILPSLAAAKDEMSGSIVMIIEDADQCLVPRRANSKDGNMNAISSLLNLGDGILGGILDLRIVATTNAKEIEMDPAIKRPGRLSQYIHVGTLDPSEAAQVLYRLTSRKIATNKPMTLAETYLKARELGWKPPTKTAAQKYEDNPIRNEII